MKTLLSLGGMGTKTLVLLAVVVVLLVLVFAYVYLALTFVDKKDNKVVDSLKKEIKVLKPGWHWIVPIRDRIVATVSMAEKVFSNSKPVSIAATNDNCYKLSYTVSYHVVDAIQYYKKSDKFEESIENAVNKCLVEYFAKEKVSAGTDFYKSSEKAVAYLNNYIKEYGIEATDVVLNSVSK